MVNRAHKVQYFDSEGRENLPLVLKSVKNYLRGSVVDGTPSPKKIVFLTGLGEGPMLAFNQLSGLDVTIIAVTFPKYFAITLDNGETVVPEMPEKVRKFFKGVDIPIVTGRLPFDEIAGAEFHNKEMATIKNTLSLFGGSVPLAIQAVLQATDGGFVNVGEQIIAVTSDTALLVTASTTQTFLSKGCGLMVNEIICKPRTFTISRPKREGLTGTKVSDQVDSKGSTTLQTEDVSGSRQL